DGGGEKVCVLRKTRVPVKAQAEIKTEQRSIKGQAHDVSDSGAYLSVSEDMAEGLMIRVTLHLPGYDRPLEAAGRIAWVNNGDRRPKPHFPEGIGVEFTVFNENCEHDLQDYVQQNQPVHKYHGTIH
ncbi:MAG: PilZ domain-containing protein, partial [Desulfuromonadales bacterium]